MLEKRYTAILCDDETSLLELLQNSIEWKKMNIDIVATARDGKKSVEEIVSCQPDFAILDINMPIYNGIEVIERVRFYQKKTQFIILSGYDDFEYAREAMRYGVRYYLLKPLQLMELFEALYTLMKLVDEDKDEDFPSELREQMISTALNELISGKRTKAIDIDSIIKNFNLAITNTRSHVLVYCLDESDLQNTTEELQKSKENLQKNNKYIPCVFFIYQGNIVSICNTCETDISTIAKSHLDILENSMNLPFFCGIGSEVEALSNCSFSYSKALAAIGSRFYDKNRKIFSFKDICFKKPPSINLTPDCHNFCVLIQDQDCNNQKIQEMVDSFLKKVLYAHNAPAHYVINMCQTLLIQIKNEFQKETQCNLSYVFERESFFKISYYQELRNLLVQTIENASVYYRAIFYYTKYDSEKMKSAYSNESVILETLLALDEDSTLSIEILAQKMHFSPAYFAIFFKSKTDVNLSDYLFDRKMLLARELLLQEQLTIFEISEKLLYNDYRSFSRAFKKYHNLSPSQFSRFYRITSSNK